MTITKTTHLPKRLHRFHRRTGEFPIPLLMLNKQIQCILKLTIQALLIIFLIRLRHTRHWSRDLFFLAGILRSGIGSGLGVPHEHLNHMVRLGLLRANENLVVPCVFGVRIVLADIPRGGLPFLDFPLPVFVRRRPLLKVEVFRERESLALVQSLLVQIKRLLEGRQISCNLRRAGNHHSSVDRIARRHDGENWRLGRACRPCCLCRGCCSCV